MIAREPQRAAQSEFDLIVLGAGIYGISLTLEAARRGLRPLLLEARDFGGETSWNSLRIVHGGLRYLQSMDLRRFRQSVVERRWFLNHFPDLVRPSACLMPLYGKGLRRPSVFRVAMQLNDLLASDRNDGLAEESRLPRGKILSVAKTCELIPSIDRRELRAGALWYDAYLTNPSRLMIEMLHWAACCGATALNYMPAVALVQSSGRVQGIVARDVVSDTEHELHAPIVVNCAGPWSRQIARQFDREIPALFHPSIGVNLLIRRPPPATCMWAVTSRRKDGGTYFLCPLGDMTLAGTYHASWPGPTLTESLPEEIVRSFVEEINSAVPGYELGPEEVAREIWGFLPAQKAGSHRQARSPVILHHGAQDGPNGLFTISGVKLTTARRVAEECLLEISKWRSTPPPQVGGTGRPQPVSIPSVAGIRGLQATEGGKELQEIIARLIETESVVRPDDLWLRRTEWGLDPSTCRELEELAGSDSVFPPAVSRARLANGPGGTA